MTEKNGRFEAPTAIPVEKPLATSKIHPATRCLVMQLFGCLAVGVCIALAWTTEDMSARLSLILAGADLAAGAYNVGVWSQRVKSKGGPANG